MEGTALSQVKKVIIIAAVSQNGIYGEGEELPWRLAGMRLRGDMQHFKKVTTSHTVVMGRKTWESIPAKFRPLPDRDNFVLSEQDGYVAQGAKVCKTLEDAIGQATTDQIFCIGGKVVWSLAADLADEAWITVVKHDFPVTANTRYAAYLDNSSFWSGFYLAEEKEFEEEGVSFTIKHLVRKK